MPNWAGFQEALARAGQGAGTWANKERERSLEWQLYQKQKEFDLQNAIALEKAKSGIEMNNPLNRLLNTSKVVDALWKMGINPGDVFGGQGMPNMGAVNPSRINTEGQVIDLRPEQFGSKPVDSGTEFIPETPARMRPKSFEMTPFGVRPKEFEPIKSPEQIQEEIGIKVNEQSQLEAGKPLSGDVAGRYSGALQGIRDIKAIKDMIGLTQDKSGKVTMGKNAKNLIYKANLSIEGAQIGKDTFPTNLVPFGQAFYRGTKMLRGGDEGSRLGNYFLTLSENLLRARTGATAPDPEVIREYARSLLKGFIESPETWMSKLGQNEEYLVGMAKALRPYNWQKDLETGGSMTSQTKDQFTKGQTIQKNGKTYTYQGNGQWEY